MAFTFTTEVAADYVMIVTLSLLMACCHRSAGPMLYVLGVGTLLIDCYAKAGRLNYAPRVFAQIPAEKNVMHYTAMICGLAAHLRNYDAVQLFEEMCQIRVQPNEV
ncbi:hypothetical protein PR202_gn00130 [Eleusine coracana subsp. coracana]|uniref:Pentatricopeptide repeat-containing protein n=1 Tax=Eleusine coracana subsp. coracana TaxID=191504 RepID=A0AAV5G0M4_ELECO|nr:hypothetical protein PR202_gn00130 [Eleusine coracana subsp. coracana]